MQVSFPALVDLGCWWFVKEYFLYMDRLRKMTLSLGFVKAHDQIWENYESQNVSCPFHSLFNSKHAAVPVWLWSNVRCDFLNNAGGNRRHQAAMLQRTTHFWGLYECWPGGYYRIEKLSPQGSCFTFLFQTLLSLLLLLGVSFLFLSFTVSSNAVTIG